MKGAVFTGLIVSFDGVFWMWRLWAELKECEVWVGFEQAQSLKALGMYLM